MKGGISLKDKPVFRRIAVVGFVNEELKVFVKLNMLDVVHLRILSQA